MSVISIKFSMNSLYLQVERLHLATHLSSKADVLSSRFFEGNQLFTPFSCYNATQRTCVIHIHERKQEKSFLYKLAHALKREKEYYFYYFFPLYAVHNMQISVNEMKKKKKNIFLIIFIFSFRMALKEKKIKVFKFILFAYGVASLSGMCLCVNSVFCVCAHNMSIFF